MSQTARESRMLGSSLQQLRDAAWNSFVAEYVSGVDDDPGDARQRYRDQLARIDRIAEQRSIPMPEWGGNQHG